MSRCWFYGIGDKDVKINFLSSVLQRVVFVVIADFESEFKASDFCRRGAASRNVGLFA